MVVNKPGPVGMRLADCKQVAEHSFEVLVDIQFESMRLTDMPVESKLDYMQSDKMDCMIVECSLVG